MPAESGHAPSLGGVLVGSRGLLDQRLGDCATVALDALQSHDLIQKHSERSDEVVWMDPKNVWEVNDVQDTANVQELSELFSAIEEESEDTVDFSLLIEGEDAFNVEDVSEMFTDLEEEEAAVEISSSTVSSDEEDARVVNEVSSLFSDLEQEWQASESSSTSSEPSAEDWTAALDVDDVSTLFSELEALQNTAQAPVSRAAPVETSRAVDPRIFVPSFPIRMEGAPAVKLSTSRLMVGPSSLLAGPPALRPGVAAAADKRKGRPSAPRATSQEISETRRACAAKRRRVNGRFTAEKCAFVPITALQP